MKEPAPPPSPFFLPSSSSISSVPNPPSFHPVSFFLLDLSPFLFLSFVFSPHFLLLLSLFSPCTSITPSPLSPFFSPLSSSYISALSSISSSSPFSFPLGSLFFIPLRYRIFLLFHLYHIRFLISMTFFLSSSSFRLLPPHRSLTDTVSIELGLVQPQSNCPLSLSNLRRKHYQKTRGKKEGTDHTSRKTLVALCGWGFFFFLLSFLCDLKSSPEFW